MTAFIDTDDFLSGSEQWVQLDQQWGTPIDLDTEEDHTPVIMTVFSTLDLRKSTFDSSFLFKKDRKKVRRNFSKKSMDYVEFLQDLNKAPRNTPDKEFYFINGQILSAVSVEEICHNIDEIFKSVEKLCSATSTVRIDRRQKSILPELVQCSISTGDLSFDDTLVNDSEKEKGDSDNVDRYIDEVFSQINSTLMRTLSNENLDESSKESVTTLVKKFTSILESPGLKCSPRQRRQCCNRFKDLAEFWKTQILENGNKTGSDNNSN